jgi:hypothetical protein
MTKRRRIQSGVSASASKTNHLYAIMKPTLGPPLEGNIQGFAMEYYPLAPVSPFGYLRVATGFGDSS